MSEIREDPGCLTLSEDMMDERDFKAEGSHQTRQHRTS